MNPIKAIIQNRQLSYNQKIIKLAQQAENTLSEINSDEEIKKLQKQKVICDLFEGNAPYRPRYVLPDYEKFMKQGSKFLNLEPPKTLLEAVNALLIMYKNVPSITTFPVFLGNIDALLEPFITNTSFDYEIIKMFLTNIDRTLVDSFVHANIGPKATKAGSLILKAEKELQNVVPNLSLKYNHKTSDEFAKEAIATSLSSAKPYFVNHDMFVNDFGENYGIASCYNGLPVGGGSYTLVRMNLKNLTFEAKNSKEFSEKQLPFAVKTMSRLMDNRIEFLTEKSGFFESSFLVKEGLIYKDRFTAMFGIHGLAECVNKLMIKDNKKGRFGHNDIANELGEKILKQLEKEVNNHINSKCLVSNKNFLLHAQCGIGDDVNTSPGCRIPAGDEPETMEQILQASLYHKYFPTGISDVFTFDSTAKNNPDFVLDIIKGAMNSGIRVFAFYTKDSDLIRVTGYLAKKSEMKKFKNGEQNLQNTVELAQPAANSLNINYRKKIATIG